jgi:hypothetical protein
MPDPESPAEGDDPKYRSPRPRVVMRGWIVPDRPAPEAARYRLAVHEWMRRTLPEGHTDCARLIYSLEDALVRAEAALAAESSQRRWAEGQVDRQAEEIAAARREAEAGRELARAVVTAWEAAGNVGATRRPIGPGDAEHLRRMALCLLAPGKPPGKPPGGSPDGPAPADPGASDRPEGLSGDPGASGEVSPPGDWPEDSGHENGNYQNRCVECGRTFTGHKRRVVCRACAQPEPVSPPGPASPRACPFVHSGGSPAGLETLPARLGQYRDLYRVVCRACGAVGPVAETPDLALAAWDRRADDAPGDAPDAPGDAPDAPGDAPDAPGDAPDAPGDAPDAPGIDAEAIERAARKAICGVAGHCFALPPSLVNHVADILRAELGPAPAAGRGGDAKGGRDAGA